MIARAAAGELVRWDAEIFGRAGGKETIIIDASLMPVRDQDGKVAFIAAEGRDITEKKAYERDDLTEPFTQEQLLQTAARLVRPAPPGLRLSKDREPGG